MAAELRTIALQIDPDVRLAAAVGGAARFLADAAGLASGLVAELQKSVIAACREAFKHLESDRAHLSVALTRFPDRIEVVLAQKGTAAPFVGLDQIAGLGPLPGLASGEHLLGGFDRVQYESQGNMAITRFTKYLGAGS